MKNSFTQLIHKPRIVVPVVAVLAIIAGVFLYSRVGNAPVVSVPQDANGLQTNNDSSVNQSDLAFPKAGRVASVSVSVGENVRKGEVLATLDAPDALGAINQAKGALELARAQYASLDVQYQNAKKQQDVLVANAYRTLLSSGLSATSGGQNDGVIPTISGTYTCGKEGNYTITPYASGALSGYSFNYDGLEKGVGTVSFETPQTMGSCGLSIQFASNFNPSTKWTVLIPNTKSSEYTQNKNAYDLAVSTRSQTLSQLEANLGKGDGANANVAKAAVDAAEGTYEAAVGAYQNNLIVAPFDGVVTFVDSHLKVGQSETPNKTVISISKK